MTEANARRNAATRAKAAVKAVRWARKHDSRGWRRPWALAPAAAIAGGVALGASLGLTVESSGPFDRIFAPAAVVAAEATQLETAAVEPEIVPVPNERAPIRETPKSPTEEVVLAPAAGPFDGLEILDLYELEHGVDASPPRDLIVYEEPLDAGEPSPGPNAQQIEAAIQQAALAPIVVPEAPDEATPLWQQNSVQVADSGGRPMIAIVIDDLGLNRINARRTIALPPPLTLAFMTYARGLEPMTAAARTVGHELMVHVPMEPNDGSYDAGERVLTIGLSPEEIARRLKWGLDRFEGYVGINNHMGSRFTASPLGMAKVMAELKSRGLLFLDSKTSSDSVGSGLAARMGVANASRDVFIDNEPESMDSIRVQLAKLEKIARLRGTAIGIGHPHDTTIEVLAQWLTEVESRGFKLVPVSAIVRQRSEVVEAKADAG